MSRLTKISFEEAKNETRMLTERNNGPDGPGASRRSNVFAHTMTQAHGNTIRHECYSQKKLTREKKNCPFPKKKLATEK